MPDFLWRTRESWARRLALAPLLPLEGLYRIGVRVHRVAYQLSPARRVRLPAQVVSVGNLTVGGSGKTPLVGWLAAELAGRGHKVAILSRGVGGRRGRQVNVVSDGERVLLSSADVGDEPLLLAGAVPGVPVLAGRNRAALGYRAAALFGAELLLLDDGFQHQRGARDLDLGCVDAELGLGTGHVLPRGPLREAACGLRRADALVWTRTPEGFSTKAAAATLPRAPGCPNFAVRMVPRALRPLGGGAPEPISSLAGREIAVLAAIARPDRLIGALESHGARVVAVRRFPDHHLYSREDLDSLEGARTWVTTAKDAVKIPRSWPGEREVLVLEEEVVPLESGGLTAWVLEQLERKARAREKA